MKIILVIDDNEEVSSIVTAVLRNFGFEVREATSGETGIQMVLKRKAGPDHQQRANPGMDGHHLLGAIRELRSTAQSLSLMTGSGSHDDFRRGMLSGADDYLQKPFTPDELIEAVLSRLIRQTDLQMEAYDHANRMRLPAFEPAPGGSALPLADALHPA